MTNADLSEANLPDAHLLRANLVGTDMSDAKLCRTTADGTVKNRDCSK